MRIDTKNRSIEVGHVIYGPSLKRTAQATEAQFLLMQYSFEVLAFRRYEWKCDSLNAPSRSAAERLGFTFEGIFRQHLIVKGRNRDTAWFSILDGDWPVVKTAFQSWLAPRNFSDDGKQIKSLSDCRGSL
jgi:RimJ/RimL family protein N-acetyltransferase